MVTDCECVKHYESRWPPTGLFDIRLNWSSCWFLMLLHLSLCLAPVSAALRTWRWSTRSCCTSRLLLISPPRSVAPCTSVSTWCRIFISFFLHCLFQRFPWWYYYILNFIWYMTPTVWSWTKLHIWDKSVPLNVSNMFYVICDRCRSNSVSFPALLFL